MTNSECRMTKEFQMTKSEIRASSFFRISSLVIRHCCLASRLCISIVSRLSKTGFFGTETTLQPLGLLPLLGGCTAGYLVSALLMRNTIMTEKLARRGVRVPVEYAADFLDLIHVEEACSQDVVYLRADQTVDEVRHWAAARKSHTSHQGFPVLDIEGNLIGVVTRRDLLSHSLVSTETFAEPLMELIPALAEYA